MCGRAIDFQAFPSLPGSPLRASPRGSLNGFGVDPANPSTDKVALGTLDHAPLSGLHIKRLQTLKVAEKQSATQLRRAPQEILGVRRPNNSSTPRSPELPS